MWLAKWALVVLGTVGSAVSILGWFGVGPRVFMSPWPSILVLWLAYIAAVLWAGYHFKRLNIKSRTKGELPYVPETETSKFAREVTKDKPPG
jgi:hypothetical protein